MYRNITFFLVFPPNYSEKLLHINVLPELSEGMPGTSLVTMVSPHHNLTILWEQVGYTRILNKEMVQQTPDTITLAMGKLVKADFIEMQRMWFDPIKRINHEFAFQTQQSGRVTQDNCYATSYSGAVWWFTCLDDWATEKTFSPVVMDHWVEGQVYPRNRRPNDRNMRFADQNK